MNEDDSTQKKDGTIYEKDLDDGRKKNSNEKNKGDNRYEKKSTDFPVKKVITSHPKEDNEECVVEKKDLESNPNSTKVRDPKDRKII